MTASSTTREDGRVLCSHVDDGGHGCATKLLWTRVQGGVIEALAADDARRARRLLRARAVRRSPPERRPSPLTPTTTRKATMAELEIRNLHVRAGDKQILKGLDLTVGKGEIHALMGPNGSGKSTLANAIMGHPASR